jgi:hypothetical protein
MQRLKFPFAVAVTSLALVFGLVVVGALAAGSVLAGGLGWGGPPWAGRGGPWGGDHGPGFNMPAEIAGLKDVPADQRFAHFKGARVNLTDKDGKPVAVEVTPGVVSAASATSLTLTANDGSSKSFALDAKTNTRGKTPAQNDKVVVVTINGATTAVVVPGEHGFGPPWAGGWHQ